MSTNDEAESSVDSEGEGEQTAPAADQPDAEKTRNPLEEARAEIERVRDQLLRTAADYDNFRKRT